MPAEASLSRTLASFYWQLAGRIWQDIPLDENAKPTEFTRYTEYFLLKTPRFQGPMEPVLKEMATATYLEAVHRGREPRAYLRMTSRKTSALARRCKSLHGMTGVQISAWLMDTYSIRWHIEKDSEHGLLQLIEALAMDNSHSLVKYLLKTLIKANGRPDSDEEAVLDALREFADTHLRPRPGAGLVERLADRLEAVDDVLKSWAGRLLKQPRIALLDVTRELKILPRMVPAPIFLMASVVLSLLSVIQGLEGLNGLDELALTAVVTVALLYAVDVLSYIVHVERDGWGDGAEAKAFQDHHDFPDEAGRWTVGRSISSTAPVVIPLLIVLLVSKPHFSVAIGGAVALMGLLFLTQTHGRAHVADQDLAAWIKILQKYHVILPKAPHEHHHDTLKGSYGVFNGWSNRLMNAIGYREFYTSIRMKCGGDSPIWERQLAAREREDNKMTALPVQEHS